MFKAVKEAIKEFKEYSMGCENHRYIVCITNEFCEVESSRVKKEDI